ncbi:MAG: ATP-binding protein [Treponema sp.]|nr:ATP-binding protein [Treponema sp.]
MNGYVKKAFKKASKLSNEQLRNILDDLMEENEVLYSVLESITTGLMILDNNFCLLRSNAITESRVSFLVHPSDPKVSSMKVWEILNDEEIAQFFKNCEEKEITNSSDEFSIATEGGTVRFLNIIMTPLIHKGKLAGRIIQIRDITEKKKQEVILHRMENMANLTNLAAGMAHEIKNPLGAISIHIQLIQKALAKARENENVLPPKKFVEDHIDVINEEIEHLNKLIMDFLMAVRPVKATLELKNPTRLIKGIVDFITPEFTSNNIKVNFTASEKEVKILLDEKLFRDIIVNLAQNSLEAIKTRFNITKDSAEASTENEWKNCSEKSPFFDIEAFCNENKYILRISDNGCGMNSETVSKIFEPYYTTKANGTGLGMTMVYKIVKEFSGEIRVKSEENVGSSFTMVFPIPQKDKKLLSAKA